MIVELISGKKGRDFNIESRAQSRYNGRMDRN
jgi:hypothetical protein